MATFWDAIRISAAYAFGHVDEPGPTAKVVLDLFRRQPSIAPSPQCDGSEAGSSRDPEASVDPRVWRKGAWVRVGSTCDPAVEAKSGLRRGCIGRVVMLYRDGINCQVEALTAAGMRHIGIDAKQHPLLSFNLDGWLPLHAVAFLLGLSFDDSTPLATKPGCWPGDSDVEAAGALLRDVLAADMAAAATPAPGTDGLPALALLSPFAPAFLWEPVLRACPAAAREGYDHSRGHRQSAAASLRGAIFDAGSSRVPIDQESPLDSTGGGNDDADDNEGEAAAQLLWWLMRRSGQDPTAAAAAVELVERSPRASLSTRACVDDGPLAAQRRGALVRKGSPAAVAAAAPGAELGEGEVARVARVYPLLPLAGSGGSGGSGGSSGGGSAQQQATLYQCAAAREVDVSVLGGGRDLEVRTHETSVIVCYRSSVLSRKFRHPKICKLY